MNRLRRLSLRTVAIAAAACIASTVAVAGAASLVTRGDIKNNTIKMKDLNKRVRGLIENSGSAGPQGPPGAPGNPGTPGANGSSNETAVTNLGDAFDATNSSCSLTPDGFECGPYADGGAAAGSLFYSGLNGQPLSAVESVLPRSLHERRRHRRRRGALPEDLPRGRQP